jgi:LPXTG-motif cell wall-anchored protein
VFVVSDEDLSKPPADFKPPYPAPPGYEWAVTADGTAVLVKKGEVTRKKPAAGADLPEVGKKLPGTGDSSVLGSLLTVLSLVAAAGGGSVLALRRRKSDEREGREAEKGGIAGA